MHEKTVAKAIRKQSDDKNTIRNMAHPGKVLLQLPLLLIQVSPYDEQQS